ncbi:MAG: DJ-1/PfpI family protein [Puniceicoccales bacterium]|jgi:4-methyl-5(b-hydroxyethyl)-thiazole monophosphate biosynthesis|nr:DJ-1/PfpI family protein [Puniceicoccales bacterium]
MKKKICVIFTDGVEEIELVVPVDICRRCGIAVALVSAGASTHISGAHGIRLEADTTISAMGSDEFDALFLPGGPGSFALKDDAAVLAIVRGFHAAGKLICALCAAPLILSNAGILGGRKFCSHPCTHAELPGVDAAENVVVDGNLITGKGPGAAAQFAFAIVERLLGRSAADAIKRDLFF